MRGITSTIALIAVLAGLGAYIYFVDSKRPDAGTERKDKVFAVEVDQIDELRVTAGGETSLLQKSDAGWQMLEPTKTEGDGTEATSIATNLSSLELNRIVDENAADLAAYGLAEPRVTVAFKAGTGPGGAIALGDKTPTLSDIYAVKPGEKKVFLVSAFIESTFDKKPFDLRDKHILKFDRDKVDALSLVRGADSIRMSRTGSDWKIDAPAPGRADYSAIEGLLTRLTTSSMSSLVEAGATDVAKYGLDKPTMTVTVGAGSSQTVLEVGKTEGDKPFARDKARPLVFTLDATLTEDMAKSFDDFYKKDLFEFRPFSANRVRIVHTTDAGAKTWEFERTPGSGEVRETWKVTPAGGTAMDVVPTNIDDLLTKLGSMRTLSFVPPGTATGLDKPTLVASVSYEDGKFERVRMTRKDVQWVAAREGESKTGYIDAGAAETLVQALATAVTPPAAPAPPAAADAKK